MLPAPTATMDRAGRKRKNGEVTALVDLIEGVHSAPGTAASPLPAWLTRPADAGIHLPEPPRNPADSEP